MYKIKKVEYDLAEGGWIGVVSDTHVPTRAGHVPPEIFRFLDKAALIIHAGDLVEEKVFGDLQSIAPVEAVAGNMDPLIFHKKLGKKKIISAGGVNIGLMHGRGSVQDAPKRAYEDFFSDAADVKVDGIVFGHTHFAVMEYYEGVLMFNPGSPVEPRMGSNYSCGCLWVENGALKGKIYKIK